MMLWKLECPVGLSQKRICAHFSEGNLANSYIMELRIVLVLVGRK